MLRGRKSQDYGWQDCGEATREALSFSFTLHLRFRMEWRESEEAQNERRGHCSEEGRVRTMGGRIVGKPPGKPFLFLSLSISGLGWSGGRVRKHRMKGEDIAQRKEESGLQVAGLRGRQSGDHRYQEHDFNLGCRSSLLPALRGRVTCL